MVTIRIGEDSRPLQDADQAWLTQQVNRRRQDGLPICIEVTIKTNDLNVRLATPGCGGGAGGRAPSPHEMEVFELWSKHRLNSDEFTGGSLVAFVKQLTRLL